MKNFLILTLFVLFSLKVYKATSQAQITNVPISSTSLPPGWAFKGIVGIIESTVGRDDSFSAAISSEGSFLTTNRLSDVQFLTFYCRVPQYEDDYSIVVETSTNANDWLQVASFEQKFDPTKFTAENKTAFQTITVTHNVAGDVYFRWSIKNYKKGKLLLDDFSYSKIPQSQNDQAVTQRQLDDTEKELKELIRQQTVFANYANAQVRFNEAAFSMKKNVRLLSNILDKSSNLYLISTTADKLAKRNEMVNPWSYDKFKSFISTLDNKLPRVKKIQLADVLNIVKVPLLAADKILLGGALSMFGNTVKSLVGDAFSPANLKAAGVGNGQIAAQENEGVSMYNDVKDFLGILIAENDKVTRLNGSVKLVSEESEALMREAELQLLKYLRLINQPNPELVISKLKTSRNAAIASIEAQINSYSQNQLGDINSFNANQSKFTSSQNLYLSRILELGSESDVLRMKYPPITSKMLSFYNDLKNDASAPNPLTARANSKIFDATTSDRWTSFQTDIQTNLDQLISTFRVSYIEYNLFD